jgi:competence protein ComEC
MRNRPIVWIAFVWIVGATTALEWELRIIPLWAAVGMAALAVCAVILRLPGRFWLGMALLLGVSIGYNSWYDQQNRSELIPERFGLEAEQLAGSRIIVKGVILSEVDVDGDRVAFTIRAKEATINDRTAALGEEKLQVSLRLATEEEQSTARTWRRGDTAELAGELRLPSPARNFGGFDYGRYLYYHHIHWQLNMKGAENASIGSASVDWTTMRLLRTLDHWRTHLGRYMDRWYGEQGGFMKSLVIGIREDLDPEQFRQFSELGLTHILAISGLHVAVVLGGLASALRLARITRESNLLICMLAVPPYVVLTGASPSAIRAGLMALLALFALRVRIAKDALHLAAMAAIAMLIIQPYYLFDVGFQLSFLVTTGLIIGVPRFSRLLPLKPKWLADTIAVTTVAQWVSFPITVYYFNQFSLLSWTANLLLVPVLSLIVLPLGMVSLIAGLIWEPLGGWIGWPASYVNQLSFHLVESVSSWRWGKIVWASPSWWWIAAYYGLLSALYLSIIHWKTQGRARWIGAVGAAWMVLLFHGYHPDWMDKQGAIQFIDVGQGDAILIRTPEKRTILIDGGGTVSFRKPDEEVWRDRRDPFEVGRKLLVPLLKKRGIHHIDWLVVSHYDMDHIGGLQAVIEDIPVRAVLSNDTVGESPAAKALASQWLDRNIPVYSASRGQSMVIDKYTSMEVLHPAAPSHELTPTKEQNGHSIVILLTMYEKQFLFTGDIGMKEEHGIAFDRFSSTTNSAIDVLKIAHHGSKHSTSEEWLAAWSPRMAVVSAGARNVYGHPHPFVVDRISQQGAQLLRTDQDGEIDMRVNEEGISVSTKLP